MIPAMTRGIFLPLVFGVFWTAIVGVFDVMIGRTIYQDIRSLSFASTEGVVTHSEVTRHSGGKGGPTYGVDIRYKYFVETQELAGDNHRYGAMSSSDSDWAHEAVAAHSVGSRITVHYDAQNPSDSVLVPGIDGAELFMLIFLTPFNAVMLGLWWFGGTLLWHWWSGSEPELVQSFRDGGSLRVRLPQYPAIPSGLGAAALAAFVCVFPIAFIFGFHPSMTVALAAWVVILGTGVGVGAWLWRKEREGAFDVIIDDRRVELPAMFDRKRRETLERSMISGTAVVTIERPGRRGAVNTSYSVRLLRLGGGHEQVAEWYDEDQAKALAAWFREQLKLPKTAR
jgi:hypothetical protein